MLDCTLTVICPKKTETGNLKEVERNQTYMIVISLKVFLQNCRQVSKEKNFAVEEVVKASLMLLDQI